MATVVLLGALIATAGVVAAPVVAGVAPDDPAVADLVKTLKSLGVTDQEIADLAAVSDLDAAKDWFLPSTGGPSTATGPDIVAGTFFELKASPEVAASWFAAGGVLASGSPGVVAPVAPLNAQAGTEFYVYATNLAEPFAGASGRRVEAGVAAFDTTPIGGGAAVHAPAAPGDFFGAMNVAWSTRSEDGGAFAIHHFQYLEAGGSWREAQTDAISLISGRVLITLIPEVEASDVESARAFTYAGGLDFDPATIAADTYPDIAAAPKPAADVPVIEVAAATETPAPATTPPATTAGAPSAAATPAASAGGGGTTTSTSQLPWILLIASGIALALVGGGLLLRGGKPIQGGGPAVVQVAELQPPPVAPPKPDPKAPPEPPGLAPPAPPTTSRPDPCACTCTATIEGPRQLNVCPCDKLTYEVTGAGGTVGTLKGLRPDGSIAFSKTFRCKVAMSCAGGATASAVSADWTVVRDGDWLTISATGRGEYECADGAGACTCTAPPFKVRLLPGPGCIVEVVTLELGYTELIGHVAIRLMCGETDELWGYFPKDRASVLAPFKGTPGSVDHRSASSDKVDGIGKNYSGYYCKNGKKVWAIQLSCDQCEKVRTYWENLEKNPGTYVLASANCATRALDSLAKAGVKLNRPKHDAEFEEDYQWSEDAYRPGLVDDLMDQLAREGGASQQLVIDANPGCTSDH